MEKQVRQSSLLSDSVVYALANGLAALVPFTLVPILTRHLLPEAYGEVAMFHILVSGLIGLVGLNIAGAAGRKYFDHGVTERQMRNYGGACLQVLAASCLAWLLLVMVFGSRVSAWLEIKVEWLLAAVLVAALEALVQLRLSQWQVRKQPKKFGTLLVLQSVSGFLLSVLLVVVLLWGAEGRILAQILTACVFGLLALLLLYRDRLLVFWSWQSEDVIDVLRFGVPLLPHVVGGVLLLYVDRMVITREIGLAATGTYMVAFQVSAAAMLVFSAINNAYVPWLFERLAQDDAVEKRRIVRYTYLWFLTISLASALAFLIGPFLVTLIAGNAYAEAGSVIGLLVLGQVFGGMYLMVTNYIFYSKKTGALSLATLLAGLANVGLLLILVPSYGIVGAAMAFAAAMGMRFVLTWVLAARRHPMPWFSFR